LISVSDKEGILDLAKKLTKDYNYEIVSTGGTASLLKKSNIPVIEVSEITKFPEMLEGRVKTLHPAVHGALLAKRNSSEHMKTIQDHGIVPIDLVVINLYPFEEVVSKGNASDEEIIENIDIGGPSMLRSAAKNYSAVTVISDPGDYISLLEELKTNNGSTSLKFRKEMATKVFQRTSAYDSLINSYFLKSDETGSNGKIFTFPKNINLNLILKQALRYGENPHQKAALYVQADSLYGLPSAECIQGKELSFNNYLDLESAWNIASEFDARTPVAVVVKHNNPCGVAIAPDLKHAYIEAFNSDPVSAFGGIVAFNGKVEADLAIELKSIFLECIIAPDFSNDAIKILNEKPNVRVLKIKSSPDISKDFDIKTIRGGYLIQESNQKTIDSHNLNVVTKKNPTEQEIIDLVFAWKVCKHVKSNAIVIAKEGKTIGIGAGQTSRVASVEIALKTASSDSADAVLASDAFFPFKDSIEICASAKISAIIQPGGSIKDKEVIEACDKYGIGMIFTGIRHFRH
jgi:phosphoribosylaminoimidazolecarboxamide formyltransferase/IMP cyclohydrolase